MGVHGLYMEVVGQSWARTLYPHTITYMYAHAHTNTSLLRALLTDETYFYIWSNRGTNRSWILSNFDTLLGEKCN